MYQGGCEICGIQQCPSDDISDNSIQGIDYNLLLSCLRTCEFRCSSNHSFVDEICHNEYKVMNEFCQNCHVKLARLISIYLQVHSLLKELDHLKADVKANIQNTCGQRLAPNGLEAGNNEEKLERTTTILREISSALGITEEKVVDEGESHAASFEKTPQHASKVTQATLKANPIKEDEGEGEEGFATDCHDDSPMESSNNQCDNVSDKHDLWSQLRQIHGVKDCTVRLDRLGPDELADWTSRIAPRKKMGRPKKTPSDRKKIHQGPLGKRIYCGFPGCSRYMFKEEDVERHKILKHRVQTNLSPSGQKLLERYRYHCLEPNCNFVGPTQKSLKIHATVNHATNLTDSSVQEKDATADTCARCDQPGCSLTFYTTLSLRRHKKHVHNVECDSDGEEKLITYHCDVPGCRSSSYSKIRLDAHKAKVHENVSHPYKCDKCGQYLNSYATYKMHMKAIHGGTKDSVCHICGKAFAVEQYLKLHMRMHNPPKVKCRFCPKVYFNAAARVQHERAIHTGERPFVCDRCGKGFVGGHRLKKHVGAVHNKDFRPFICQLCGKDYPVHEYLRTHYVNAHKGHRIPSSKECLRQSELPSTSTIRNEPAITIAEGCNGIDPAVPASTYSSQ